MPQDLIRALAIEWWRERRPLGWTAKQHIGNPTINCATDAEKNLAQAVADYLTD